MRKPPRTAIAATFVAVCLSFALPTAASAADALPQRAPLTTAMGDSPDITTDIKRGERFADGNVPLSGTCRPGDDVRISLDARTVATVPCVDRRWSHELEEPIADGLHFLRATQGMISVIHNGIEARTQFITGVDFEPGVHEPLRMGNPIPGRTDAGYEPFSGFGEPGAEIDLLLDGVSFASRSRTTQVGLDGMWIETHSHQTVDKYLTPGDHVLTVTQIVDGVSETQTVPFTIVDGERGSEWPNIGKDDSPGQDDRFELGYKTFTGTGEPGTPVRLWLNDERITTLVIPESGEWEFDSPVDLEVGKHRFTSTVFFYGSHVKWTRAFYIDPPAETEQPPVETEEPPVETEQPPAETEQPPAETEEPPAETEQPPVETEQPPAETEDSGKKVGLASTGTEIAPGLIAGIGAILLAAAAGIVLALRRRSAQD